ncbi:hydrolase [Halobacteriovorax marinus]|uniref:Hydrolase n=1 Tax=Halobacteriovorax marinus TaxID=97084 RepID=A0A1Y5F583_9BACT|nr:hydrolase [Halobacteriovorax marinus]
MLSSCGTFGTRPKGAMLEQIQKSPQYNSEKKSFINRRHKVIAEMKKDSMNWGTMKEWLFGGVNRVPKMELPQVKPDIAEFLTPSKELKVIWFGHSTFLLNMSGKIILVDPVFSGSAAPFSFMVKRFQKPALSLEELPAIDYIVISHDHYDHLDMESIQFFKDKKTKFVTPLGVGSHLVGWGIERERISELDWWDKLEVEGVSFIATPSQHFSGRDGFHDNETLWASWVIQNSEHNIYFSGDSGYDEHFKKIGEKYGPFDLAFIENGQYNLKWRAVHMMPEEAAQAYFDLGAKKFFPVHWGMFELSFHTWFDPIVEISEQAKKRGIELVTPRLGEVISLSEDLKTTSWWEPLIEKGVTQLAKLDEVKD